MTSACGPAGPAISAAGPNSSTGSPERATPSATARGPWSAPFASTAITRRRSRPRPAARRPRGRRRCRSSGRRGAGRRGALQRGQCLRPGVSILCCERRLFVREWDCLCLGTAMRAGRIACPRRSAAVASRYVRLRDRRGRLRRLRACQPPVRGSGRERAAARGGRTGHERPRPPARRVLGALPDRPGLGPLDDLRAVRERPPHLPPAREGAGRLVVDQRDGLHPRQPDRLRRVGPGLDLGRDAPLLQARRGQRARRGRVPRGRRTASGVGGALAQPARPGVPRLGRGARSARERGLQRRGAGRRRLVPGDTPERRARERGRGVPAPGDGPAQPDRRDARARAVAAVRGRARRRRRRHAAVARCSCTAPSAR